MDRMHTTDPTAGELPTAIAARWKREYEEWQKIRDELAQAAAARGERVTAYDVTEEQRRRMKARGEEPLSAAELFR